MFSCFRMAAWVIGLNAILPSAAWTSEAGVVDLSKPAGESLPAITGVYWKFDEINDNQIRDSSGNVHDGTFTCPAGQAELRPGVDRSGTSGYLSGALLRPDPGTPAEARNGRVVFVLGTSQTAQNSLNMVDCDFTAGAWVKYNQLPQPDQRSVIFSKGSIESTKFGGAYGLMLERNKPGNWRIRFTVSDGERVATVASEQINPGIQVNEWNHIGVTFRFQSGADHQVTLWLNGQPIHSEATSVSPQPGDASLGARTLSVGERSTSTWFSVLDGVVDDFFITEGAHSFTAP